MHNPTEETSNFERVDIPMPASSITAAQLEIPIETQSSTHWNRVVQAFHDTLKPIRYDFQESDGARAKASTALAGASFVGSQILDRMRISVVLVPEVGTRVLEETQSPTLTAIAAGVANYVWTSGVGEAATQGLVSYPNTVDAFARQFPKFVDFFQQGLPGLEDRRDRNTTRPINPEDNSLIVRAQNNTMTHIKRTGTGMGLGSTAFVATAKTLGYTKGEMRKENHKVALDTSILVGVVGFGLGKYVTDLSNKGDYEKVETISSWVGNSKNWLAVAGILIASDYISKKVQNRKDRIENEKEQARLIELNRTKLPEKYIEKITPTKAWMAIGAIALADKIGSHKPKHTTPIQVADALSRVVIDKLNKKKKFNIGK